MKIKRKKADFRKKPNRTKKGKIFDWLSNGIGLLLCIVALGSVISGEYLPAFFCLLLGISITKFFSNLLMKIGLNLPKWLKVICVIVLFFAYSLTVSPENAKETINDLNRVASIIEDHQEEQPNEETSKIETTNDTSNNVSDDDLFKGYKKIEVNTCNLSGDREPNVVVDIGYGDREYWAFTNEYGQLVKVIAKKIELQHDSEDITSNGRYCSDEAKVSGVEDKDLDEGHIIADSLGGVSNAYNITPQNNTLNRHGDQAYMEKMIRDAGGCTDFTAIITYPNTTTQIPSHYSYTYKINGQVINDEFDNKNPEETNQSSDSNSTNQNSSTNSDQTIEQTPLGDKVWISATGKKYHNKPDCGRMNPNTASQVTISEAQKRGLEACQKCF